MRLRRNYFIFDGESSRDYGLYITGKHTFDSAERNLNFTAVAGRNGDWLRDDKTFKNKIIKYPAFITSVGVPMADRALEINAWLQSKTRYCRLEDTYNPEYYRMGIVRGEIEYDVKQQNNAASELVIEFNCKPQRFLVSGDSFETITNGGAVANPTRFVSLPYIVIEIDGDGTLTIGDKTLTFEDITGTLIVDCDIRYASVGDANMNSHVTANDPDYLLCDPGVNRVSWTGDIESVKMKGRWWTV